MLRWKIRIRKGAYMFSDFIIMIIAFFFTEILFVDFGHDKLTITYLEIWGLISIYTCSLIGWFLIFRIYDATIQNAGKIDFGLTIRMIGSLLMSMLTVFLVMSMGSVEIPKMFSVDLVLITIGLIVLSRFLLRISLFLKSNFSPAYKNIVIIGYSKKGIEYIEEIQKYEYLNLSVVGYVNIRKPRIYENVEHLGSLDDIEAIAKDYVIDEIAVARPLLYDKRLENKLNRCQSMGITITMLLDVHSTSLAKAHVAMVGNLPVLKFHTVSLDEGQIMAKRLLDVAGSIVGMVMFIIAYIILGPLIKIGSPGPIIFKQERVGLNGRIFKVWKFRSMGVDAEAKKLALMGNNEIEGHMFKMSNDPRVTRIGKFIRKTSLDELPQFYNVLKGDMSLVGTRPPTVEEVKSYENYHHSRISIVPGITGNWQISGRSDITDFEEVVKLDLEYIAGWSIWLDVKIIIKTVVVVLRRKGSK